MNVLSSASAFNPGSDLWVVPDFKSCRWTEKLDWYLNFQIVRTQRHISPEVPQFLTYVQHESGLEAVPIVAVAKAPLMIPTESFFPNKWLVIVPVENQFQQWVKEVSGVWENLRSPTFRIFLPTGQNAGSFHKEWQKHHNFEDFSLVLD